MWSTNFKLLSHIKEKQYIIVNFLWPKFILGAAIFSTWPGYQKFSYNTPYPDFKFEGLIHAIDKWMLFLNLPLFHFSWCIRTNILHSRFPQFLLKNTYTVLKVIHTQCTYNITKMPMYSVHTQLYFAEFNLIYLQNKVLFGLIIVEFLITHLDS